MTVTAALAVWGATLSTVNTIWTLYRDKRDQGRLSVGISLKKLAQSTGGKRYIVSPFLDTGKANDVKFVLFSIANIGKRTVNITNILGTYRKPSNGHNGFAVTLSGIDLPMYINEGQLIQGSETNLDIIGENTKDLYIIDSLGRKWRVSSHDLRKARKDLLQALSADK